MLEILKETQSRDEFIEYLKKEFPVQAEKAIEDYRRFYGEIWTCFEYGFYGSSDSVPKSSDERKIKNH